MSSSVHVACWKHISFKLRNLLQLTHHLAMTRQGWRTVCQQGELCGDIGAAAPGEHRWGSARGGHNGKLTGTVKHLRRRQTLPDCMPFSPQYIPISERPPCMHGYPEACIVHGAPGK